MFFKVCNWNLESNGKKQDKGLQNVFCYIKIHLSKKWGRWRLGYTYFETRYRLKISYVDHGHTKSKHMSRGSARAPRRTGSSPAETKQQKNPRVSQLDDATLKPTERLASTEEWSKLAVTWNNGFGGCTSLAHPGTVYCIQLFPVHQQYIIMVCYETIYLWHLMTCSKYI